MTGQELLDILANMSQEDLNLEVTVFGMYSSMGSVDTVKVTGSRALHSKVIKIDSNICSG